MIRQKYINILVVIPVIALFSSCTKKFLDVDNTQQLFRESYVKDLATMQEYLRGTYYYLSSGIEAGEAQATYADLASDNLRPAGATSTASIYSWTQEAITASNMATLWKNCYMTIRMCSFVIDNVDEYRKDDPDWANDIKGQAFAVRALIYFKLINVFSQPYTFTIDGSHPGVPYITNSDITKSYTRQSAFEVYAGMIEDLTRAIKLLPETVADTRYMNRMAAKALLARVYLFKEDFTNAKSLAKEVIDVVPLMTIAAGYPNDIFRLKSPSTTETLFQLSPISSDLLGRFVRRTPLRYYSTSDMAGILLEYPNDVRRNWVKDSTIGGSKFQLIRKFPIAVSPEVPTVTNPDIAYYTPIIRSSEMFLTAAESAAKTGDESAALGYLNAIRKRANSSIADINASGNALLDSIYKERRKELSFEGLRMFDLLRWKAGVNRTDVLPGAPVNLIYPNDKAISPIPLDEARLGGISQNIGY